MKILLLNPHVDAQHKTVLTLKARGIALLLPSNADEAWQVLKLHGTSVDLAVIHREGAQNGDPGVELLYKIKKDPTQADLPILFTTESWAPEQCASHQRTPMGANAYLRWPFDETVLLKTIDAIFSPSEAASQAPAPPSAEATAIRITEHPRMDPPKSGEFVLEEPSSIFEKAGSGETSIKLDEPQVQAAAEAASQATPEAAAPEAVAPEKASQPIEISSSITGQGAESPPPAPQTSVEISTALEGSGQTGSMGEVGSMGIPPETSAVFAGSQGSPEGSEDSALAREMPYLFSKAGKPVAVAPDAFARAFIQPVGDAVVPGGATHAPDTETLKKYLMLREQDVAALSAQLKATRDELAATKAELGAERSTREDLQFKVEEQSRKIEDFARDKALALEGVQAELEELRFQAKAKADKAKLLEMQVNEAAEQIERLKERVRSDIRKIRVRERELENKLEIAKKDSEAILAARENKIIELKRKLDLLEFNMDLLQDRYAREKDTSAKFREKLAKAAQVVRVAEGLLDEPGAGPAAPVTPAGGETPMNLDGAASKVS